MPRAITELASKTSKVQEAAKKPHKDRVSKLNKTRKANDRQESSRRKWRELSFYDTTDECGGMKRFDPGNAGFVGADACAKRSPPSSPRSTEISLRPRTQLRQTFASRRSAITVIRNSVENGVHRRNAPSPTRVGFAGAGTCAKRSPPSSPRSTEISLRPRT